MNIDWGTLGPVDIGASFNAGLATGRETAREMMLQDALRAYSSNPDDPRALVLLRRVDPQLAASVEDAAFQRGERGRATEARAALSDYLLAGRGGAAPNALGGNREPMPRPLDGGPSAPRVAGLAGDSSTPPQPMQNALAPQAITALSAMPADPGPGAVPPMTGARAAAYERLVRADPETALEAGTAEAQMTRAQFEMAKEINDFAMQQLAGVSDQASYDAARSRVRGLWEQYGIDPAAIDQLPAQWSPEVQRQLQLQGMDTNEQLARIFQERRLEWDIEDDEIDNQALEDFRSETIRVRERGQDISSADRRSDPRRSVNRAPRSAGAIYADIMDRWRRGENPNPREREFVRSYEQRSRGGRGGGNNPAANGPPEGMIIDGPQGSLIRRGGQWVPYRG